MKVAGSVIKDRRLNYQLSQRQLATGICAQATVSLIENQNNCPNLEILHPICHRLRLNLTAVIQTTNGIKEIERAIINHDKQRARSIFHRIPKRQFMMHRHLNSYLCYQGVFALNDSDEFNAMYFFNKVISLHHYHDVFYRGWANLGLGCVYSKLNDPGKALEFLQIADQQFNYELCLKSVDRFKLFIKLRLKIGKLLGQLNCYQQANDVNFRTIAILVKSESMYKLGDLYQQLNVNYLKLNSLSQARKALKRAQMFTQLYQTPGSLTDLS